MNPLKTFLDQAGYTTLTGSQGDIRSFLAGLIQSTLSIVGVIFFIMVLYGGYLWLTAGGNEEQIKKAHQFITRAIIGFMITLLALIITRTVTSLISQSTATTNYYGTQTGAAPEQGFWCRYTGFGEGC